MPAHDGTWLLIGGHPACCMGIGEHASRRFTARRAPAEHSQGADCLSASGKCVRVMIVLTPRPARQDRGSPGAVRPARNDALKLGTATGEVVTAKAAKAPAPAQSCLAASLEPVY